MNLSVGILFFSMSVLLISLCILKRIFRGTIILKERLHQIKNKTITDAVRQKNIEKNGKQPELLKKFRPFINKKYVDRLEDRLAMAGVALRAEEFIALWIIAVTGPPCLVMFFSINWIVAAGFFIIGSVVPPMWVFSIMKKRREVFARQLPDALAMMCNSLQTGFSLQIALLSVGEEMAEPISTEFARLAREMQLGINIDEGMYRMVERTKNDDLALIAITVSIQRQIGGNLSEILDSISKTINARIALANEVKLLTTTGRTSGLLIGALPAVILIALMILNPEYVEMFFQTLQGRLMLIIAGIMEIIGFIVVNKVVTIKY